ncbi:DNA-directed RNA polymerase III subunit RPC6 [Perkinsus chesapeaki]|uniref:DNA-directed RNA polymerase III subunit RPC6 n=1 Tax=Perkinsus chesapeaki TaxID=330153 RepID=A0A7J6M0L8_PERCH|nr:DNA-directed RNA polymerase III subunit RPC6 [Perkinsus chesapeaki]
MARAADVEELLQLLTDNPDGLTNEDLEKTGWEKQKLLQCLNPLLQAGRVDISKTPGGKLLYTAVPAEIAQKLRGLDQTFRMIYKLIKMAGTQGIWNKDLATRANMEHRIASGSVTKICSQLEARRLIKKVTSVQHKSRKVWMLYELEPSKEVSGGNWYRDGRLDTDLIERLRQCCLDYITNQNRAVTCEDVHRYVVSQGVSHITHSVEEIGDVLRSLELDRVIMVVPSTAGEAIAKQCYVARPANLGLDYTTRIIDVPCIACPVSAECMIACLVVTGICSSDLSAVCRMSLSAFIADTGRAAPGQNAPKVAGAVVRPVQENPALRARQQEFFNCDPKEVLGGISKAFRNAYEGAVEEFEVATKEMNPQPSRATLERLKVQTEVSASLLSDVLLNALMYVEEKDVAKPQATGKVDAAAETRELQALEEEYARLIEETAKTELRYRTKKEREEKLREYVKMEHVVVDKLEHIGQRLSGQQPQQHSQQ